MATATTTPGASRITRRDTCTVHRVEWGQVYVKNDQTRESGWFPQFCPKCEQEFARGARCHEELKRQAEEIAAEADRRIAADETGVEQDKEEASAMMAEDAGRYVLEFFAKNRAAYEAHAAEQRWNRVAAQITTERREEFWERIQKAESEAK